MRKSFDAFVAAACAIVAVAFWSNATIRADAALTTFGPMTTDSQINVLDLTRNTRGLSGQEFAAH
jgi:hypothetical protein